MESFDNQRLFFWYSKSWCRPLATSDHDFYWSNNALQCHAAFYSFVVYIHGMLFFFAVCPAKTAQKACGVSGCRKAKLPRCLPGLRCAEGTEPAGFCPALPVLLQVAPWLCFTLYWADRLIRNPSIVLSLPCSPGSHGHPCVIFLSLVGLWGFLQFFCTDSTGVSVLNVCPVEVTEEDIFLSSFTQV